MDLKDGWKKYGKRKDERGQDKERRLGYRIVDDGEARWSVESVLGSPLYVIIQIPQQDLKSQDWLGTIFLSIDNVQLLSLKTVMLSFRSLLWLNGVVE